MYQRFFKPYFKILTFNIPIFVPIYHPSAYQLIQKHQIYANWMPSYLWWPLPDLYTKICKEVPKKGRHICVYHVNVKPPHPVLHQSFVNLKNLRYMDKKQVQTTEEYPKVSWHPHPQTSMEYCIWTLSGAPWRKPDIMASINM